MIRCAPGVKPSYGSCFTLEQLVKIAWAFNQQWMENNEHRKINIRHDKKYLLQELRSRLIGPCGDNEACWLEQNFVKMLNDVDISRFTLRPHGPSGRFQWLSTTHIEDVLAQYEKVYNDFLFLGAVPMDFRDLPSLGLSDLDYNWLESKGYTKLGVVFNTDEHWKPGQHWVAAYTDIRSGQVYYFDSTGSRPEVRVTWYLAQNTHHIIKTPTCPLNRFSALDIRYNMTPHQRGNTECGVFCVNFIIRLLNGESFDQISNRRLSDKEVNYCRQVYFRNTLF